MPSLRSAAVLRARASENWCAGASRPRGGGTHIIARYEAANCRTGHAEASLTVYNFILCSTCHAQQYKTGHWTVCGSYAHGYSPITALAHQRCPRDEPALTRSAP